MQIIEFGAQRFSARADRTLWHPDSSTLLLSDLHLGKGAHFRQSGIPVPDGGETDDLNRLSKRHHRNQCNLGMDSWRFVSSSAIHH